MAVGFLRQDWAAAVELYIASNIVFIKQVGYDTNLRGAVLLIDFWYSRTLGQATTMCRIDTRGPQRPIILYEITKSPDFRMDFHISGMISY